MEPFRRRDISWPIGRGSPFSSSTSSSEYGSQRNYTYPPTPPSLYPSRSNRADATQSSDTGRKSSPAENKVKSNAQLLQNLNHPTIKPAIMWNASTSDEVNSYEEPFSLSMSFSDWIKLSDDLKIFETDQRFGTPF